LFCFFLGLVLLPPAPLPEDLVSYRSQRAKWAEEALNHCSCDDYDLIDLPRIPRETS